MKYSLYMIICSLLAGECMEPFKTKGTYDSMYACLNAGYEESLRKSKEIGKKDVNEHQIYIKFICNGEKTIIPKPKPKGKPI